MTEALTATIKPVDDIPVLLTSATRLGPAELVDHCASATGMHEPSGFISQMSGLAQM